MARRLRFNGTNSGNGGCPALHEDLDTGEWIVQGKPLSRPEDLGQLQYFHDGETAVVVPPELLVDFGPKEVTRVPKIINLDEFAELFKTFEHSAWRLETRRGYASDREDETYREFVETGTVTWDFDNEWCRNMQAQTAAGKRVGRVRILDDPPTPGQLYLLNNAKRNSATGEDMRNLWRADAERLQLPAEDFWIFDSRFIALLHFDEAACKVSNHRSGRGDVNLPLGIAQCKKTGTQKLHGPKLYMAGKNPSLKECFRRLSMRGTFSPATRSSRTPRATRMRPYVPGCGAKSCCTSPERSSASSCGRRRCTPESARPQRSQPSLTASQA